MRHQQRFDNGNGELVEAAIFVRDNLVHEKV